MRRRLGLVGTVARAALGLWLVGDVLVGHIRGPFRPLPWLLGLMVMPALMIISHRWWVRRHPGRLHAVGPIGHLTHLALFCGLLSLPYFVPNLWFAADAGLLFYGSAMILAAVLGQGGCEVM